MGGGLGWRGPGLVTNSTLLSLLFSQMMGVLDLNQAKRHLTVCWFSSNLEGTEEIIFFQMGSSVFPQNKN